MSIVPTAKIGMRVGKFSWLGAIILLLITAGPVPAAVVTENGFQIQLNGQPFVIKGMNYSPVPIGTAPGNVPYGDYFVSDYANVWQTSTTFGKQGSTSSNCTPEIPT